MSACEGLTAPLVVAASPRWDLRMGNLCMKALSSGFTGAVNHWKDLI